MSNTLRKLATGTETELLAAPITPIGIPVRFPPPNSDCINETVSSMPIVSWPHVSRMSYPIFMPMKNKGLVIINYIIAVCVSAVTS